MFDRTPTVSSKDIDRIVRRDYPVCEASKVRAILDRYDSREPCQVHAAALKEAAGDIEKLKQMIELAKIDYRDVLAAAEYPGQMKRGLSVKNDLETRQADAKQYYDWFNRK